MANRWNSWIRRWWPRNPPADVADQRAERETQPDIHGNQSTPKTASPVSAPDWLVPNGEAFSPPADIEIRKQIFASWVQTALHMELSHSQWNTIISTHAVALVNAGAGSGKTATMTLRLLALNVLYDVPYNQTHVFTFNVTAATEFRNRFMEYRTQWDAHRGFESHSQQYQHEANSCITTFNSAFYGIRKLLQHPGDAKPVIFDYLGAKSPHFTTPSPDVPDVDTVPYAKLTGLQRELLRIAHTIALTIPAYRKIFNEHPIYRPKIPPANPQYNPHYVDIVTQWKRTLATISKVSQKTRLIPEMQAVIQWLQAQHYTVAVDDGTCQFVLSAPHNVQDRYSVTYSPMVVEGRHLHWSDRYQETIQRYATNFLDHYWLTQEMFQNGRLTEGAAEQLRHYLNRHVTDLSTKVQEGLGFVVRGEASAYPAYEDYWQESIGFFFNLGRDPVDLATEIAHAPSPYQRNAQLLQYFIPALREVLETQGLMLQGDLDAQLIEQLEEEGSEHWIDLLMGYRHIIIDEFQDINPVLVRAIQSILRIQRPHRPSIMAVGDDWQSIYSWRGSNPEYLVHFFQYFSNPDPRTYQLTECYRCSQSILTAAAQIIQGIPTTPTARRTEKPLLSHTPWQDLSGISTLHLIESTAAVSEIVHAVNRIIREAQMTWNPPRPEPITIQCLFATNDALKNWNRHAKQSWMKIFPPSCTILNPLTIHRAKGLQAHVAIIVGSLNARTNHGIQEAAWNSAGLMPPYGEIQRDEIYRLGYVAVTRARWGVIWIPQSAGSTMASTSRSAYSEFAIAVNAEKERVSTTGH